MNTDSENTENEECNTPVVGSSVSFYQDSNKDLTDTGKVVRVIKNDAEEKNPILEIKPSKMDYDKVWRTVKELI